MRRAALWIAWAAGFGAAALHAAEPVVSLPDLVVTATRGPLSVDRTPLAVDRFDATRIRATSTLALDDLLRDSAAFSLFRRTNSLAAHPTAQGVSLRGLGPSGASRSLVLLDGVPLNDPFGGWVAWTKVPRLALREVEVVRGGGSAVWGNTALSGVVQLFTEGPAAGTSVASAEGGSLGTVAAEFATTLEAGRTGTLSVAGRTFSTDGFSPLSASEQGSVDRPLKAQHQLVTVDHGGTFDSGWAYGLGGRLFDEERGNGTRYQRNSTRETAGRLLLAGPLGPTASLEIRAYAQRQNFSSTFSSVAPGRSTETPSLDQFAVPATAAGAALVLQLRHDGGAATTLGGDVRQVAGETREDFLLADGAFQRRRFAGGSQTTAGIFVAHQQPLARNLDASLSLRADHWFNYDGHRREQVRATGATLRDDRFASSSGAELSPAAGLVWRATEALRLRAAFSRAFRVPTLNELHRPFRVGSVATDANPALRPEHATSGELGFSFARPRWELAGGYFAASLRDTVANVTRTTSPALTQRQRLNLDLVRARGVELQVTFRPTDRLRLHADYLWADPVVRRATVAPALVGRRLAQVPRHTGVLRAALRVSATVDIHLGLRATSRQFEDDENRLPLAPLFSADLGVEWRLDARTVLAVAAENLTNRRTETARALNGPTTYGPPRQLRVGLTHTW